jgi:hypothetical protein
MKYKELRDLVMAIHQVSGNQETKIQKKLFKVYEKVKSTYEDYLEKIEELRLDNALTDDKGGLILNEQGKYRFNKEGLKKLNKDINALEDQEFAFEKIPVVNPQGLEEFTFLKDWLSGVEFKEEEAEEEL